MPTSLPTIHKSHAPVINPYDKLTQNQFDSYVSNIQSKIQLALNPPSPEPQHVSRSIAEISQSTIASPAPSPAPLSKRPSLEPRASSKAYTPLGAGTPNEPYELSDDDDENNELKPQAETLYSSGSEADADSDEEREQVPLSAIPEGPEEGDEVEEEAGTDEAYYSGYENENGPHEVEWDYSGEDASEDEEVSGGEEAEEEIEEEEDVFIGKGKGRHPAEGPGLAALLNSSGTHRTGGATGTPERIGHSSRALDDSFEEGVGRMPTLGVTSTPFISRLRSGLTRSQEDSEEENEGSDPWEASQGLSMPAVATYQEDGSGQEYSDEEFDDEDKGPGAAREDAIEVLDSDEEEEIAPTPKGVEVNEIAPSPSSTNQPERLHDATEFDELQFDDSAAYPDEGREPDSLLDDTMDEDDSMRLQVLTDGIPPGPSSLFSASSIAVTREPSQSKDVEELDQSADTVHAPEYSVEEPGINTAADPERELDQPSIQRSLDYSDFIGEHSLLAQDTSITQAEQQLHEVTVYELENGSRYYDFDGVRHFLNPEGEVYETVAIPPPRPTIQQPPDLSIIQEVSEYDITRRMVGIDDDNENEGANLDFLKELDDTFSSVGEPILRYPDGDDSMALGMDDIPQRPGAALGFRSRDAPGMDSSAFLSDSIVLGDDLTAEHNTSQHHAILNQLGPKSSFVSATGTIDESMNGRNADDLVSEDDIVSASEAGEVDADDSQDSILDDDDDDGDTTRELDSRFLDRDDLVTPVPPGKADESGMESQIQLDEKGVADALAAVAQLADEVSFEEFMNAGGVQGPNMNDSIFDPTSNLDNLLNEVSSMSAQEEDMLARSFNMADALQNATIPLDSLPTFDAPSAHMVEATVESSIPSELNPVPFIVADEAPEKLASEVLAEVFEGVEPISMSSVTGTGTATPSGEPEPSAHIEEIEVLSRSPTPKQPLPLTETENQEPSPRRTPPTPTLSAGQSLTAPELSIATSISEASGAQPNVSVYEGSPTSSSHREDPTQIIPPTQPDTTELPDPNLPPSPTHLSMPAVPTAPNISEAHGEVSPSVVVEPPTPLARSEDGVETNATVKPVEAEVPVSAPASVDEKGVDDENKPAVVEKEQVDEKADVVGPLPQNMSTPSRRSRTRSPAARSSTRESSASRATPSPSEKMRAGEKRKRLEDLPSPASTPLKLSVKSPARLNKETRSPLSEAEPSPDTPTPRRNQSLFKRTPTSKPLSTASGSSSRKASGSDSAPAPWPMRNRTHRHTSTNQTSVTSPGRSKANTSTGSPLSRPTCRFHKVIILGDDQDANIEFIVPACALGQPEVLKEHNAEDCGLSTAEDETAMVTDFGDIEPSVISKLKALVGATLFDEGVCGYLSKSPAKVSRPAPNRLKGSLRGSVSDFKFEPTSESESKTISAQPKPKPRSRPSILHDNRLYKPPAEDSESDDTAEEGHTRKRPKHKKQDTIGSMSSVKFPSLGQDSPEKPALQGRVPISRRMKRARRPADAQLYKPDPNQEESSPDDEAKGNARKRTKHRATSVVRRANSNTPTQEISQAEDENENPFKPKRELNRVLSPEAVGGETRHQSVSSVLDSKPDSAEQKDLEQHVELGDHPGEVVDEEGRQVDVKELSEPAPAKVAVYVERDAPSEIGKNESNGAGENALGTKNSTKKGWSKFLRF